MTLAIESDEMITEELVHSKDVEQKWNSDKNSVMSNKELDDDDSHAEDKAKDVNAGWADSVGKILRTKKPKGKKTLVLSKAKKLNDIVREKLKAVEFQIDEELKEEKPDTFKLLDEIKKKEYGPTEIKRQRKEYSSIRVKPNILDKDRERTLSKIATRGVVQLFNVVRGQQKDIVNRLEEAGSLERKRDKALKSIDKRQFLNVLMGEKSQAVDEPVKNEPAQSKTPDGTWSVLREDFMMGAKLKDWDKDESEP